MNGADGKKRGAGGNNKWVTIGIVAGLAVAATLGGIAWWRRRQQQTEGGGSGGDPWSHVILRCATAPRGAEDGGAVRRALVDIAVSDQETVRYMDVCDAVTGGGKLVVYQAPDWRPTLTARRRCRSGAEREAVLVRDRVTLAPVPDAPPCARAWAAVQAELAAQGWTCAEWDLDVQRRPSDMVAWSLAWLTREGVLPAPTTGA